MARYIDAERLLKVFEYWVSNNIKQKEHFTYKAVEALIEAQPTADVVEREKILKWIEEKKAEARNGR